MNGLKIYPGHGKKFVRSDGRLFNFLSGKCERLFHMKRNPRKITWTVLYRKQHKKGITEEVQKKRNRRTTKFTRPVEGSNVAEILAKRNQKPEIRKAQREQAIKAAKEKNVAKKTAKKELKAAQQAAVKAQTKSQKASKPIKTAAPRIGGKR